MRLRSFKLRFAHRHVRIELEGEPAGVDLSGEAADAALELGAPLLAQVEERAPGAAVRALSVDLEARRLLASLAPRDGAPSALRIEGVALDRAGPLLALLEAFAGAS